MCIPAHSTPGNVLDFWLYGEVLRAGKDVKERPHLCKKCKFSEQASCEVIAFLCELPALCVCPVDFSNLQMCNLWQAGWPVLGLKLTQPCHVAFIEDIHPGG